MKGCNDNHMRDSMRVALCTALAELLMGAGPVWAATQGGTPIPAPDVFGARVSWASSADKSTVLIVTTSYKTSGNAPGRVGCELITLGKDSCRSAAINPESWLLHRLPGLVQLIHVATASTDPLLAVESLASDEMRYSVGVHLYDTHTWKSVAFLAMRSNGIAHLGGLAPCGDWNGDGASDVAACGESEKGGDAVVLVFSGKDGSILNTPSGKVLDGACRARSICEISSNSARASGIAIGCPGFGCEGRADSLVIGIGPKPAEIAWSQSGTNSAGKAMDWLGVLMFQIGDLDKDGYGDLGAIASGISGLTSDSRCVAVLSGKSGKAMFTIEDPIASNRGRCVASKAGDVDRDGVPDVCVGFDSGSGERLLSIVSGATHKALLPLDARKNQGVWLASMDGGIDCNSDSVPDVIVGLIGNGIGTGVLDICSGADGRLIRSVVQSVEPIESHSVP